MFLTHEKVNTDSDVQWHSDVNLNKEEILPSAGNDFFFVISTSHGHPYFSFIRYVAQIGETFAILDTKRHNSPVLQ